MCYIAGNIFPWGAENIVRLRDLLEMLSCCSVVFSKTPGPRKHVCCPGSGSFQTTGRVKRGYLTSSVCFIDKNSIFTSVPPLRPLLCSIHKSTLVD